MNARPPPRWLAMTAVWAACSSEAPDTSDTDGASDFAEVQAVFDRSCASAGCHGGPEAQTGLDLSPGQSWEGLVNVPSAQLPVLPRVLPGEPEQSYLVAKLNGTHLDLGGAGERMPSPFGLAPNEFDTVRAWIAEGATR